MSYFFPTYLTSEKSTVPINADLQLVLNTGTNALRLALRNLNLPENSKVAIPAYCCSAVKQAVEAEKMQVIELDLKNDGTYWTEVIPEKLIEEKIAAIILVHLYGKKHPDTIGIKNFCQKENIKIIHDAAQSFGIDERNLKEDVIVYSFGVGKSVTAAGGGWIKNINQQFYIEQTRELPWFIFADKSARLALKSRIYNAFYTPIERLLIKVLSKLKPHPDKLYRMGNYQKKMASQALNELRKANEIREINFNALKTAIANSKNIKLAYEDTKGINYKLVLFCYTDPDSFRYYLKKNKVPYYSLFSSQINSQHTKLAHFKTNANRFVEISCEASLPATEIQRVVEIIGKY